MVQEETRERQNISRKSSRGMVKLRAHHGLCISFFRGKGYSPEFTEHMKAVIEGLKDNPKLILSKGEDDICLACPNRTDRGCSEKEKVEKYDRKVLELCGLDEQTAGGITWEEFHKTVKEKIIGPGKRRQVCGNCQWDEMCLSPVDPE